MLSRLGFANENIKRNKPLKSPFLRTGSKKRAVNLIPDYVLEVGAGTAQSEEKFDYLNRPLLEEIPITNTILKNESVDYIYTDPPYGKKIPYLDLSTMWNAWLDLDVTEADEHHKSKEDYNSLISKSIQEMYRVLKFDMWLSFVFAHKDPEFWHLIIETCEKCGFEYVGAVPQKNGQTSFKKRKHPFTVLPQFPCKKPPL